MDYLRRRVKIEVTDGVGEKIAITLEGELTRDRVLNLVNLVQFLESSEKPQEREEEEMSKFDKIQILIRRKFPTGWFTSQDLMVAYEDVYDEPVGLSTVSTYLARLAERGTVTRSGGVASRRYRLRGLETKRTKAFGRGSEGIDGLRGGFL